MDRRFGIRPKIVPISDRDVGNESHLPDVVYHAEKAAENLSMASIETNESKAADVGSSMVDSLDSQRREQLKEARKLKRSLWGATLLTICVGLCLLTTVLYALRTRDAAYAVGAGLIPFVCWFAYFRRHYFTKTPVSTDGWSTALVVVGILAAITASKNLTLKSPQEIVHEINSDMPHDTDNQQNAKMRQAFTALMKLNKEAHEIDVEFDNSYGGKNFLGTGCFLNPNVASVCLADTQKALEGYEGVIGRMSTFWKAKGETQNQLQVAQYQTMVKLFTDATDLYRYAAEPSRQVGVDPIDGGLRIVGVKEFNFKLDTALADQAAFRKATKAYVEYQNNGLKELGLKPEDLGATHYNPADFDGQTTH